MASEWPEGFLVQPLAVQFTGNVYFFIIFSKFTVITIFYIGIAQFD